MSGPTHFSGSTLYLVLTLRSAIDLVPVDNLAIICDTGTTSDHYFIKFTLPVNAQGGKIEPRIVEKDVHEYSKIDIGNFKEDLFFSPINSTEFTYVNDAVDIYLKTVENLLDKHAPCIQKKFNLRRSPWWNIQCQKARTDARKAQRHHNQDPSNVELKEIYNEKCIDKAFLIDKARNLYYDQKFSLVKMILKSHINSSTNFLIVNMVPTNCQMIKMMKPLPKIVHHFLTQK